VDLEKGPDRYKEAINHQPIHTAITPPSNERPGELSKMKLSATLGSDMERGMVGRNHQHCGEAPETVQKIPSSGGMATVKRHILKTI